MQYRRLFVDFYAWYEVGVTYIAMEYLSGGDLQDYIGTVGALEESVAKGIAEQILQALFVLHEHGYMHCDLKPEVIRTLIVSCIAICTELLRTEHLHCRNISRHH